MAICYTSHDKYLVYMHTHIRHYNVSLIIQKKCKWKKCCKIKICNCTIGYWHFLFTCFVVYVGVCRCSATLALCFITTRLAYETCWSLAGWTPCCTWTGLFTRLLILDLAYIWNHPGATGGHLFDQPLYYDCFFFFYNRRLSPFLLIFMGDTKGVRLDSLQFRGNGNMLRK